MPAACRDAGLNRRSRNAGRATPGADDAARDRLDNLKGLFHRKPYAAVMIAIAMLSLAGLPPFPGFIAKFLIFKNVIAAGFTLYAVLELVGSYLGIYFYLRVVQFLFMSAEEATPNRGTPGRLALGAGALCLLERHMRIEDAYGRLKRHHL